ncbi:MAG: biopolymer transporter ExbD, partial [Bdellovibrionales bacterium]|nr:biopolymer transporter ExbD [Bdellovibrionales bacterium]
MSIKKKALDPEIDLIAFISLLSVCICFLLLTSIWVQIGSMNFKQSIGGASGPSQPQPQLVIDFQDKGGLSLKV